MASSKHDLDDGSSFVVGSSIVTGSVSMSTVVLGRPGSAANRGTIEFGLVVGKIH